MDGIKRKGKILMGSSDLSLVIYEQKVMHEAQSKVLPCQNKVSTALLKWSYTESNANIPNLYSCWSDLDLAIQSLAQESIDHSIEYRLVFKDINQEGKRLNDIQKEKESSAKKVTAIKKQIESARKSKKSADKVKLGNLEAELSLAQSKDSEMGKLLITKTKEYEEHKATLLQESSMAYCDKSLEVLDKLRQVIAAKRDIASMMSTKPVYNGDQIKEDGVTTVEQVFSTLDMQLPVREPALDRRRCFSLGTRSSVLDTGSTTIPVAQSPKQAKTLPRGSVPSIPGSSPSMHSNSSTSSTPNRKQVETLPKKTPPSRPVNAPGMNAGRTNSLGSTGSSCAVYQGGEDLGLTDDSDDDHDYQIPNEEYFGKNKHDVSMESQEEEYLAPEFPIEPQSCPRVPPRQESMQSNQSFDSSAGTSGIPGDYMMVVEDHEDEARMPPAPTSRSSTDSSNSSSSTGPGRTGPIKLPRALPSSNGTNLVEGEDFCWRDRKTPGQVQDRKSQGQTQSQVQGLVQELQSKQDKEVGKDKEPGMLKRKPQPLPKPAVDIKPKPKPKPKPSPTMTPRAKDIKPAVSPGSKDKPMPLPRSSSTEKEQENEEAGGFYEIMSAADAQKIQKSQGNNSLPSVTSTYDPEEATSNHGCYYSEVYEREGEESDSDGDYCVAENVKNVKEGEKPYPELDLAHFHNFKRPDPAGEQKGQQKASDSRHTTQAGFNNNQKPSSVDTFTDEEDEAIYCNVPS